MSVPPVRPRVRCGVLALLLLGLAFGASPAAATGTASISGTVTDALGAPITTGDVCVTATQYYDEGSESVATRTDGSGHYSVTGLGAGEYDVYFADCSDSSRNDVAQHYGATQNDFSHEIALTDGQARTGIDAQLAAGTTISGHVYGGSGTSTPLNGVCVYAQAYSYDLSLEGKTDSSGAYTVSHLDPTRSYKVRFDPCDGAPEYFAKYFGGNGFSTSTPVSPTLATPSTGIDGHLDLGGSISGTVKDSNGNAITSQDICVEAYSDDESYSSYSTAETDGSGHYAIVGLATGSYVVRFSDCEASTRNDLPAAAPGHVSVTQGAETSGVDVQLAAGTSISGHVYGGSGTGTPITGACVEAESNSDYSDATTDGSGAYTIRHLTPSEAYKVGFEPCGGGSAYVRSYYDGKSSFSSADPVSPTVASPATGIDGHLPLGGSVSGAVKDSNGNAITSQDICVDVEGDGYAETTSDASGHYSVAGLPTGTYEVSYFDCSASSRNDLPGTLGGSTPQEISVTQGTASTGVDIQLASATTISGHVYGGSGTSAPLAGACVEATSSDSDSWAQTSGDGSYTIRHVVPSASYTVSFARCDAGGDYVPASVSGVSGTVANPATGVDGHLPDGGSIGGAVRDSDGQLITTQDICLEAEPSENDSGGASYGSATSDGTGHYSITGLPAGTYNISFSDCGSSARSDLPGTLGGSSAQDVTVTVGAATTGVDVQLAAATSISGHVYGGGGTSTPLAAACVRAYTAGGDEDGSASTDNLGAYKIAGLDPAVSYKVVFEPCSDDLEYAREVYDGAETLADGAILAPTAANPSTGIDGHLPAVTTISGHVYGGSGTSTPLADVCVSADESPESDFGTYSSTTTAADGSYTLRYLTPGVGYKVRFSPCSDDQWVGEYYDGQGSSSTATVVTPTNASPASGIDAHLLHTSSISGTVTDAQGAAITTGDICVRASAADFGGEDSGSAQTDDAGHYTLTGLTSGSYYVRFADCDDSARNDVPQYYGGAYESYDSTEVVLSAEGSQTGIDAQLAAGTTISGTAYAGSGSTPLEDGCVSIQPFSEDGQTDFYGAGTGTDSSGVYSVGHLPVLSGGYRVEIRDCGSGSYVATYFGGDFRYDTATAVKPTLAQPATGIDVHLPLGARIDTTISDAAGIVTSGVCAEAERLSDGNFDDYYYGYGSVDSTGHLIISGLPAGSYSISYSDCYYASSRNDLSTSRTTTVGAGGTTTTLAVTMPAATTISGHVYSSTGQPIEGVCVGAILSSASDDGYPGSGYPGEGYETDAQAYTSASGAYTLTHIDPSSSYKVEFNQCRYESPVSGYGAQFFDGVADFSQAATLHPSVADPSTGIDAHLPSQAAAPVARILSGPAKNSATNETTARFAFTSDQSGATFQCAFDGGAYETCTSPYTRSDLADGSHSFSVLASANGHTESQAHTVSWTVDTSAPTSTSQGEVSNGGTFSSDPGASPSPSTPVVTDITVPADAQITLTKEPTTTTPTNGYAVLGQQIDIAATDPNGGGTVTGSVANPIKIAFKIDASQIPDGTDHGRITVMRNGTPAADCTSTDGSATPDPCISNRTDLPGGGVEIDVLTTHCSTWNLSARPSAPSPVAGNPPVVTGTPALGSTLTASHGTWTGEGLTFTYQWLRDAQPISGATDATHLVTADDQGHQLSVRVTATNDSGHAQATSAAVSVPAAASDSTSSGGDSSGTSDTGTATTPGTQSPAPGTTSTPDTPSKGAVPAPTLKLGALGKLSLSKLLKTGIALPLTCSAPCAITLKLTIAGPLARKLGLAKKPVVTIIASGRGNLTGKGKLVVRFSHAAASALRKHKPKVVAATLTATVSGAGGSTTASFPVKLTK